MSRHYDLRSSEVHDLVIAEAARVIEDDKLIVLPTDTVYGVAADAFSPEAVERLLEAKGRDRTMPPPVLIARPETLMGIAEGVDAATMALTAEFWPGALTVICRAQPMLDWDLGDTHGTVAVRMPDHEPALDVLRRTGPLAVSSANAHGQPAALTVEDAEQMLGETIEVYLDSGPAEGQGASTIIDMTAQPPRVVRSGPISYAALAEHVPNLLDVGQEPEDPEVPAEGAAADGAPASGEADRDG